MGNELILKIVTPKGEACNLSCDSVNFLICEGNDGQSGSYGVKPNHADAVFALCAGTICAKLSGDTVFCAQISDSFAEKRGNVLTVSADKIEL